MYKRNVIQLYIVPLNFNIIVLKTLSLIIDKFEFNIARKQNIMVNII